MHLQASKQTKVQDMIIYLPMLSKKSIGGNICYSETYFQYLFRNRVFPVKLKIYRVRPIFKKRNSTLEPTIDQTQYYPAFQNYLNA